MTRLVAFLGGINVGDHRVTMDRLRGQFSDLGFGDVHWLIDGRMSDSLITLPKLTKLIGRNTTRNISSLTRLRDRL